MFLCFGVLSFVVVVCIQRYGITGKEQIQKFLIMMICKVINYASYNAENTGTKKSMSGMELYQMNKIVTSIQMR